MSMLTENKVRAFEFTDNKVRSEAIERFRTRQGQRKDPLFQTSSSKEDDLVPWKQILTTFGSIFIAGAVYLAFVFGLALLSIVFQ